MLVEAGANVNYIDLEGQSVLMRYLTIGDDLKVVAWLVENGCDLNLKDVHRRNCLMRCVKDYKFEIVDYLINAGTDMKFTLKNIDYIAASIETQANAVEILIHIVQK